MTFETHVANMNIVAYVLSIIFAEILLIEPIFSANDANQDITTIEPNGLRFQRILRRKKRFLLFPPGSAVVVSVFEINPHKNLEMKFIEFWIEIKFFFTYFFFQSLYQHLVCRLRCHSQRLWCHVRRPG